MPTTGNAAAQEKVKFLITALLLVGLMVGLAACRGFFGQAPIAILTYELPANEDQEVPVAVTFDISDSTDPDGTIVSWKLEYGDGEDSGEQTTDISTETSLLYDYTSGGTFTATLTVTDNDGRIGKDTKIVVIGPAMLTFASDRSGNYGIYRMQVGNIGSETEVRNTADEELFPDLVRGTRDKIAYVAEDGTSWNIFTMGVDGGALAQLTQTTQTPSNEIQPSWSKNGNTIAFASNTAQTPSDTTWEIYSIPATGGSWTPLTTQTPYWAIAPAYSPVNDDIVFVSNKDAEAGGSAIWLWDDSASSASELYNSGFSDGDVSSDLAVFDAALATSLNLPANSGISKPAWKPDGTKIAFSKERTQLGIIDIYVMNADGTGTPESLEAYVEGLTSTTFSNTITSGKDEFCPYWLEDNSGLVFVREEAAGNFNIYKVSFSTGLVTPLTSSATPDNNVSPASRR